MNLFIKIILTGSVIVAINEVSKHNVVLAALVKALPLISLISFILLYYSSGKNLEQVSQFSFATFWLVLPTLPLFLVFAYLLKHTNLGFYVALLISVVVMLVTYAISLKLFKLAGIKLS